MSFNPVNSQIAAELDPVSRVWLLCLDIFRNEAYYKGYDVPSISFNCFYIVTE